MSSERDFAVLHRYLRKKPNAQLIFLEAIILFARKLAPEFKEKFKGRRQEIEMKREQDMEKRIEENTRKELRARERKPNK